MEKKQDETQERPFRLIQEARYVKEGVPVARRIGGEKCRFQRSFVLYTAGGRTRLKATKDHAYLILATETPALVHLQEVHLDTELVAYYTKQEMLDLLHWGDGSLTHDKD